MAKTKNKPLKVDTSAVLEIEKSNLKSLGLLVVGIISVVISVWLTQGHAVDTRRGEISILVGWLGLVFCVPLTVMYLKTLLLGQRKPVVFSASGLRDSRLFIGEIPWSAVARIYSLTFHTTRPRLPPHYKGPRVTIGIMFELTTDGAKKLRQTRGQRFIRWLNKRYGLHLVATNLVVSHHQLRDTLVEYAVAHNPDVEIDL